MFQFKSLEAEVQLLKKHDTSKHDTSLIKVFDTKLINIKNNMHNLTVDFATWQTSQSEQRRTIKKLVERIGALEEQQEDIDLDELQGKDHISVAEIVKTIQNLQTDILKKCVTGQDMANLRDQMRQMETDTEEMTAKLQKDLSSVSKLEELAAMPSKLKDLEFDVLRNKNSNAENDMLTQKV